jgi:dolichol kinase
MAIRLHRGGRLRRWLGAQLGGDSELGERVWRRILHLFGGLALVYYLVPSNFFVLLPKWVVLLVLLAVIVTVEALRHSAGLELPTIRPFETHRIGSYAFYSAALAIALLFFPEPIAVAVILGAAIVDPLIGELRLRPTARSYYPLVGGVVYVGLAYPAFWLVGGWTVTASLVFALVAAALAITVEWPKRSWWDDDLTMILVPGLILWLLIVLLPAAPHWGR